MNILQVLPELNAGGVERTTIEIAQALNAQGHVPHVASLGGRMEDELRAAGGVLHRLSVGSKNPLSLRSNIRALTKIIKNHKIDLVHVRSRAPAWAAKPAAEGAHIPFITTYHGIYNAKSRLKRRYNAIMAKGDIIIANSEFTKAHILKEHGVDPERIVVIPRGVDMKKFDPSNVSNTDVQDIKAHWGVGNANPILLLPGRLTRWKGQLIAIQALTNLSAESHLVLLGDAQGRDAYVAEIRALISKLDLKERVIIAPHTQNMPAAFMASNLVISASTDPEAFGRVSAEAQAMQRLVAASNHGGSCETIIDGKTGRLVTPSDPSALAQGISDILAIPSAQYTKMAADARARIADKFSANALKNATLTVYKEAIKGNLPH
ncbi:MAG: glycosyltransferase family 4 protein [Robiginitomaculum sp.]